MKTLALAGAAFGLAITTAPAFAGTTQAPTISVSTAGLDLSSPEGQRLLDRRIHSAAKKVCRVTEFQTGFRMKSKESRDCYKKAVASGKRQMAAIVEDQRLGG